MKFKTKIHEFKIRDEQKEITKTGITLIPVAGLFDHSHEYEVIKDGKRIGKLSHYHKVDINKVVREPNAYFENWTTEKWNVFRGYYHYEHKFKRVRDLEDAITRIKRVIK